VIIADSVKHGKLERAKSLPSFYYVFCHPFASCFNEIQNGLLFWCWLTKIVLEKRLLNGCLYRMIHILLSITLLYCLNLAAQPVVYWQPGIIDLDDIEAWELEEFLEDILNAEFNLVCDADNDGADVSLVGNLMSV